MRWSCRFALLAAVAGATLLPGSSAEAFERRVPDSFFGVSAPELYKMTQFGRVVERDLHLAAIKTAGLDWVRSGIGWADVERSAPSGGVHAYNWRHPDAHVAALARARLALLPELLTPPDWARDPDAAGEGCGRGSALATDRVADYGAFVRAFMLRYGRGGSFWAANPALPYHPVDRIEIWNEPNWRGFWCPTPNPELFARTAHAAAVAAHQVDPGTVVVLGGLVALKENKYFSGGGLEGLAVGPFLARMTAAVPGLVDSIDAVAIHAYHPNADVSLSLLGWLRREMEAAGLGSADIMVTEYGWSTVGGDSLTEPLRALAYESLTHQIARTDCGLIGAAAHNWVGDESDPLDKQHWFGIATPLTGLLKPAGSAYVAEVALFEGRGPTPAPRRTVPVCGAPEPPDQDGDGTPDADDDYPLDPDRYTGSGETPPDEPAPPETRTRPARLPDGFFGVSLPTFPLASWDQEPHLEALQDGRLGSVREGVDWELIEPLAPGQPGHTLRWSQFDPIALQLAKHGLRLVPHIVAPPEWAGSSGPSASHVAELAVRFARRYGSGGTFWAESRHLDSALAPRAYEIGTLANVASSLWDRSPTAAEYAATYERASAALRSVDPEAQAIVSLASGGEAGTAAAFLRAMVTARGSLHGAIDGVYLQATEARTSSAVEGSVVALRAALRATGNAEAPITVGFGASTQGAGALAESARAAFYRDVTSRLARSDCGVEGVFPIAWISAEAESSQAWDWYGIADPVTAIPYPTAAGYAATAAAFLGYGEVAPARAVVHSCWSDAPDRDGDGVADAAEDFPLDPDRSTALQGPPAAPDLSGPPEFTASGSASLTYKAVGAASWWCALDGKPLAVCDPAGTSYSGLGQGAHVFEVRPVSSLGLLGPVRTHRWTVDSRSPVTRILSGPAGTIATDVARFEFGGDEDGLQFSCRLDARGWESCPAVASWRGLDDGPHRLRVAALDRAGNADPTPEVRDFEVDATPATPIVHLEAPAASGLAIEGVPLSGPRPTFLITAARAAALECRIDDESFARCGATHTPAGPLPAGGHLLEARGVTESGRPGPTATLRFMVDAEGPAVRITKPRRRTADRTPALRVRSSDQTPAALDVRCRVDSGPWLVCQRKGKSRKLRPGRHRVVVRATDVWGNVTVRQRRFKVITRG